VPDNPRIEELRRRVHKDKASIAFAQLAEEYRRAGRFQEAIETCRTGLAHHPGYLSAHVTLGRALIETGELQSAQDELKRVLAAAPENLAALKGLAEIHHRRGELQEALAHYSRALEFAPHDPDLEHLVGQITRDLAPTRPAPTVPDGLSFEEAIGEFIAHNDRTAPPAVEVVPDPVRLPVEPAVALPAEAVAAAPGPAPLAIGSYLEAVPEIAVEPGPEPAGASAETEPPRASMQVEALERWLDAIIADRERQE
jgi:tetratricopeptide (TPR) repeat protein